MAKQSYFPNYTWDICKHFKFIRNSFTIYIYFNTPSTFYLSVEKHQCIIITKLLHCSVLILFYYLKKKERRIV